jgi:hypothetical protein
VTVPSTSRASIAILSGDFNDPTNERLIWLSAAGLAVVGLALLIGTIIWWRRGRQEHPVLAPLEVMGTRSFWKSPEGDRNRRLAKVRVAGYTPTTDEPIRSEPLDLEALVRSTPQAFDDLREPSEAAADAAVESPAAFAVAGDGQVVVVHDPLPEGVAAVGEPAAPDAVAVDEPEVQEPAAADADATALAAERPVPSSPSPAVGPTSVSPDQPSPVPSTQPSPVASAHVVTPVAADVSDAGSGALASSHGDPP